MARVSEGGRKTASGVQSTPEAQCTFGAPSTWLSLVRLRREQSLTPFHQANRVYQRPYHFNTLRTPESCLENPGGMGAGPHQVRFSRMNRILVLADPPKQDNNRPKPAKFCPVAAYRALLRNTCSK